MMTLPSAARSSLVASALLLWACSAGPESQSPCSSNLRRAALFTTSTLGTAQSFSVLAGTTVTNTGATTLSGDLGVSPGTAVVGFPPGVVLPPGTTHAGDAVSMQAQSDLTVAYLAVEILLLPTAGHRWAVAGVLGIFHGMYFALFIRSSEYRAAYVMTGVVVAELSLTLILWLLTRRAIRVQRYAAMLLIGVGMVWFGQSTMR